ncbi:MAG: ABC transporter permease subunit, partial [Burkholderiales bacterium]|nr:ABC transporter permease subunit [Burkholderiales bacterium]
MTPESREAERGRVGRVGVIPRGHARLRRDALLYQAICIAATLAAAVFLVSNTLSNLSERHIASGFAFLQREAGFEISETTFISYQASDTYLRALAVGLANTFRVALIGMVLATALGVLIGIGRVSRNWLLSRITGLYVEFVRNVPLLVQLFFWYTLVTELTPPPREAVELLRDVWISNRGVFFPCPETLVPLRISSPRLEGFNFAGGAALTPEFLALLTGLVVYTAAFIGEIVRAGILSVRRQQTEAAYALGLDRWLALRLVLL